MNLIEITRTPLEETMPAPKLFFSMTSWNPVHALLEDMRELGDEWREDDLRIDADFLLGKIAPQSAPPGMVYSAGDAPKAVKIFAGLLTLQGTINQRLYDRWAFGNLLGGEDEYRDVEIALTAAREITASVRRYAVELEKYEKLKECMK